MLCLLCSQKPLSSPATVSARSRSAISTCSPPIKVTTTRQHCRISDSQRSKPDGTTRHNHCCAECSNCNGLGITSFCGGLPSFLWQACCLVPRAEHDSRHAPARAVSYDEEK